MLVEVAFAPVWNAAHLRRVLGASMTDAMLTLLLRGCGYEVTPTEFVPSAHTPKNTLLRAHRRGSFLRDALADLLPSLETVWVGLSAGSMVMTPRIGREFVQWTPPTGDDSTLGIVDFSICPHLALDGMPGNSVAAAEKWAARISGPAYAIDDETAIEVVDGTVRIVSEGQWKHFPS